jgi:hypothetical protein
VPATPEMKKHEGWLIEALHMPTRLVQQKDSIIEDLCGIAHVKEAQTFKDLEVAFDASNVKIVEEF